MDEPKLFYHARDVADIKVTYTWLGVGIGIFVSLIVFALGVWSVGH